MLDTSCHKRALRRRSFYPLNYGGMRVDFTGRSRAVRAACRSRLNWWRYNNFAEPLRKIVKLAALFTAVFLLTGCASQTKSTVHNLDTRQELYRSQPCQNAMNLAEIHDAIWWSRLVASPVILLASGGSALIPVLGLNAGLDVLDRSDASHVSVSCGGRATPMQNIIEETILNAGFGLATGLGR